MFKDIWASNPQADIMQTTAAISLAMMGVGSGKTWMIGAESGDDTLNVPDMVIGIGANTYSQLSKSTLKGVFKAWKEEYGWTQYTRHNLGGEYIVDKIPPKHFKQFGEPLKSYENTISFVNGSTYFLFSLDNYKAIDGIELGKCYLDETKDTKEEAVKEVILTRLRQPVQWVDANSVLYNRQEFDAHLVANRWRYREQDGKRVLWDVEREQEIRSHNPLKIYTSPAKVDWLNKWFDLTEHYEEINKKIHAEGEYFKLEDKDKCVVIASTFHNQENLPVSFIADKMKQYSGNENMLEMLIYGSPIAKSGGEFINKFQRLKHVPTGIVEYDPEYPVHVSFDFNVAPYMTALCAQLIPKKTGGYYLRVFKEYCLESPYNKTEAICKAILADYGHEIKAGDLFYYGDPSGRNRQTVSSDYKDNYDVIAKTWRWLVNYKSDRVLISHPSVLKSRDFTNDLFDNKYNIIIEIDRRCKNFIHDLEYAKEDENGSMIKPRVKDKTTGQTYEKLGHCLDAFRYLICSLLSKEYENSKN